MVNQRSLNKVSFHIWLPRELHAKLKKLGASKGLSAPEIIIPLLDRATAKIELTPEEREAIEKEIHVKSAKLKSKKGKTK